VAIDRQSESVSEISRQQEARTIVGPSAEKLRVALATLEKKIVTKYNIFLRPKHFLVLEGYDPRIHALYYCPQLYKYDGDKKLIPLEGEEIGKLVAKAVQNGVVEKQPVVSAFGNVATQAYRRWKNGF